MWTSVQTEPANDQRNGLFINYRIIRPRPKALEPEALKRFTREFQALVFARWTGFSHKQNLAAPSGSDKRVPALTQSRPCFEAHT